MGKGRTHKSRLLLISSIILFISAIFVLLFPFINNLLYRLNNQSTIKEYENNVSSLAEEDKNKYLEEARAYNKSLTDTVTDAFLPFSYKDIRPEYESVLNFNNGQICTIEIPKIDVNLPVYHGTSEDVLEHGASHSANTSFPIGGADTHAVISAHTAYPGKIFFDNLTELEVGDKFYIKILDEKLAYEVCDINIVEPDDTSLLQIEYQRDLITLVTCYPYAVNSHRLFVRGERTIETETTPTETSTSTVDEINTNSNHKLYILTIFIFIIVGILLYLIRKRKTKNNGKNKISY